LPLAAKAKDNLKVRDAFDTLVRKILAKSPKAGQDSDGAVGVFGGGKADRYAVLRYSAVHLYNSCFRSISSIRYTAIRIDFTI
jgi:hypothetical protein